MEEELRAANEKITEILESITEAFSAWDENWRYTYVNERAVQLLGKPKERLIGNCVWDLFPEAVGTESYRKCHRAMAEREPLSYESFSPESNRWYEYDVYPTRVYRSTGATLQSASAWKPRCGAARRIWRKAKDSATQQAGPGMFPPVRSSGRSKCIAFMASILEASNHLTNSSVKSFTRRIDRLWSRRSRRWLRKAANTT